MGMNHSLALVAPELILSFSSLALLLLAAWRSDAGRLISWLAVGALIIAGVASVDQWNAAIGRDPSLNLAFDGLYSADSFAQFAKKF